MYRVINVNYFDENIDYVLYSIILMPILLVVVFYIIYKMGMKNKKEKIRKECYPQRFELLDVLFIPSLTYNSRVILRKVFIIKCVDDGEIYCSEVDSTNCLSNVVFRHFHFLHMIIKISAKRKDSTKKRKPLNIGDTGLCYIKEIVPFNLMSNSRKLSYKVIRFRDGRKYYEECTYVGGVKENRVICVGEYCNYNERENVIDNIQEYKSIKGFIEFDEI